MEYPKIYLTLDNCFAIKRWVQPKEWLPLTREIGFTSAQASFDNEIDFLYSPDWYLKRWFEQVEEQEHRSGVRVDTFFTGYQTYRTAGLGHPDDEMADYLEREWMEKAVRWLGRRKSHMGVSFFGIPDQALQEPERYHKAYQKAVERFGKIGRCAAENGIYFCSEAMYAPHQPSWTIQGTRRFLRDCTRTGAPIYTTVDVGHMIGQARFQKPSSELLEESFCDGKKEKPGLWLGAGHTRILWGELKKAQGSVREKAQRILEDMEAYGYLFSDGPEDSDPYAWLQELGCYSPIVHLQQTDGITASHAAFTEANNQKGIIRPDRVLRAIAKSYEKTEVNGMPPRAAEIYLAFEIFASNAEYCTEITGKLKETYQYWRKWIPEDGLKLDELIRRMDH